MPALDGKDRVRRRRYRFSSVQMYNKDSHATACPASRFCLLPEKSTAVWGRASQTAVGGESEIASVMLVTHIHTHAGR